MEATVLVERVGVQEVPAGFKKESKRVTVGKVVPPAWVGKAHRAKAAALEGRGVPAVSGRRVWSSCMGVLS
jgi:hypothetical protein